MRVRITLTRTIRQYLDIVVNTVESVELAVEQIEADIAEPDRRARLLNGEKWFGDDVVEPLSVLEGATKD